MSVTRTTTTSHLRSGSPAGRVNSAKLSARSNVSAKSGSQASDVGDLLSIAPAVKGKRNKTPSATGSKGKDNLQNSNGNKRSSKSKVTQSLNVTKTKSSPEKKTVGRPAWSVKPAAEDDTPRSNISLASTFNLPPKPSLNDFLDFPEDDQNIHLSALPSTQHSNGGSTKDSKKLSLLEYLSADTERSELDITGNNEKTLTGHQISTSDEKTKKVNSSYKLGQFSRNDNNKNNNDTTINDLSDDDSENFQIVKKFSDYDNIHQFNNFNKSIYTGVTSSVCDVVSTSSTSLKNKVSTVKKNKNNSDDNRISGKRNSLKGSVGIVASTKQQTNMCKDNMRNYPMSLQTQISFLEQREVAARCIQIWWRKMNIRRTAGAAAMRRMMQDKQKQIESNLSMQRQKEFDKQVQEYDQMKRRDEKARSARQNVINEMQSKRVNGIKNNKEKTKKQMKSSLPNEKGSSLKSKPSTEATTKKAVLNGGGVQLNDEKPTVINSPRPGTSSSVGRKIEEIFEASTKDGQSTAVESLCNTNDENLTYVLGDEKLSKTTYDDLLNTIKELEGEPTSLHAAKPTNVAELWGASSDGMKKETSLSVDYLQKLEVPDALPTPGSYLSADKLKNILTFLDEVEKVEEDVRSEVLRQSKEANISEVGTLLEESSLNDGGQDSMMESASQVATDIGNAILAKKQEIDEKKKSLEMMRKAMGQQKEFTTMQMVEMDKEHKQQLKLQREEYEGNIQRHLSFIDQLIDDKKALTERCEVLVTKLKDVDQKYSTKIKQLCENHALELKKQKEIGEAAEKLRREKWVKEKTQEIKEITVKGLEPDIQKLIGKHKAEIKKIKAMKQGEVLDADERVGRKYIQQIEDVRAQLEKEKETAVRKERDAARLRFESQMREEESAFQQQRRRLYQEIEEEKERCAEQMQKYKKECDEKQSAMEESFKQTAMYSQGDHEKQLKEIQKNHETELKNYKEQIDIEKQQWIGNYMKKQETHLLTKERELKEDVRDARDKEIEMVISRLEKEATVNREEAEKTAENRIKRLRDKYEKEIKELEQSEKSIQEKYNSIKERMAESEGEQLQLKSGCKQKEQELIDMKKITDRLQEERGKVTDIIRQEFADRLVVLEEESKRLRTELSEEKARHKFDVDKLTASKEEEMDELHKRVKKAIANKDENSKMLRDKMLAAEKRAEHLEQLLTDQRKKLLAD